MSVLLHVITSSLISGLIGCKQQVAFVTANWFAELEFTAYGSRTSVHRLVFLDLYVLPARKKHVPIMKKHVLSTCVICALLVRFCGRA